MVTLGAGGCTPGRAQRPAAHAGSAADGPAAPVVRPDGARRRVVILCTGNSCRSQIAEALWRHHGGPRWEVYSAGTQPAAQIHPLAVQVMAERGFDLRGQHPKGLDALPPGPFDLLVTVCDGAAGQCPTIPGVRARLHWPLPDPPAAGPSDAERLACARQVRDALEQRIRALLAEPQWAACGVSSPSATSP